MGIRLSDLNDKQLSMIDAKERKRLGKAGETVAEAAAREFLRLERADHADFSNWLLLKGIVFEHDDPTRRTSNRKGWPDFRLFYGGRVLLVEFKVKPNKLSTEQEDVKRELQGQGFHYIVAYSLSEAIEGAASYLLRKEDRF